MSASPKVKNPYRRVPGLRGSSGRSVLRLAADHLLVCDYRTGFVERYRRFYFRDIEAIIIRKTKHWMVGLAIWGFIALCFLVIGRATQWNLFFSIVEGVCALFILWNAIRGPSCRTHIQTAVQLDRLPMLKRVRKAQRVLRLLVPLIQEAQGKREMQSGAGVPVGESSPAPMAVPARVDPLSLKEEAILPPRELSWLHLITFALASLCGLLALWEVNYPSKGSFVTLVVVFCLAAVGGIIALVRQARRRVHGGAAASIWVLVISYVAGGAWVNTGYSFADQFLRLRVQGATGTPAPAPFHEISPLRMRHMGGFDYVLWTLGILSLILGLLGLTFALMPPPPRLQPPPLPKERT